MSNTLHLGYRYNVQLTLEEVAFIEAALRDCADTIRKNKAYKFDTEADRKNLVQDNLNLANSIHQRIVQ